MTAHERLKKDFEEFKKSILQELVGKGQINPDDTRLDRIERRLDELEKQKSSIIKLGG